MNCTLPKGCLNEVHCKYFGVCLSKLLSDNVTPEKHLKTNKRLLKYMGENKCDFSNGCNSCQQGRCTFKNFIFHKIDKSEPVNQ